VAKLIEIHRMIREYSSQTANSLIHDFYGPISHPDFLALLRHRIPSALITNDSLLYHAGNKSDYLMISTGMSDEEEIEHAVKISNPNLIFHTNSAYPSPIQDLNLNYIEWLKEKYPDKEIGYSGHEFGLITTYASVVKGATWVERHITLERTMWGSDHMASVEPHGLIKLVKDIRSIEDAMGIKGPRKVFESELVKRETLRG